MYKANLNCFQDNPWQPRKTMRQDRLEELAVKIYSLKATRPETLGLLQMPAARLVDGQNKPVPLSLVRHLIPAKGDLTKFLKEQKFSLQLAWGHRRRAAFGLLVEGLFVPAGEEGGVGHMLADADYQFFPFELVEFTDQEMFELAVTENGDRDDLTTIETAQAMVTYRDQFGRSSAEIGKLFGMNGSTVRNMIRLLDLPDGPRQALAEGRMSQGTGRALLAFYALPESFRNTRHWYKNDYWDGQRLEAAAAEGMIASDVEALIDALFRNAAKDMSDCRWRHSEVFPEEEGVQHPDCKGCPARVERSKRQYCTMPACYRTKERIWTRMYLQKASEVIGLPLVEDGKDYHRVTRFDGDQGVLEKAKAIQCPNLCLRYNDNVGSYRKHVLPEPEMYPDVEVICGKMQQHCTCFQAKKAGVELAPRVDGQEVVYRPLVLGEPTRHETSENGVADVAIMPDETPTPAPISEQELKDANRKIREQKRQARIEIEGIMQEAARGFVNELGAGHLGVWKKLAHSIHYELGRDEPSVIEVQIGIGRRLVEQLFQFESDKGDPAWTLKKVNRWLKEMGLDELQWAEDAAPVSTETLTGNTPARIDATQDGQVIATYASLAEVDQTLLVPGTTLKAVYENGKTLVDIFDPVSGLLERLAAFEDYCLSTSFPAPDEDQKRQEFQELMAEVEAYRSDERIRNSRARIVSLQMAFDPEIPIPEL